VVIDLAGKVALVTGGNKGIGRAIAQLFTEQGARVIVNYPNDLNLPERLDELGEAAIAICADVGKIAEIDQLFAEVEQRVGRLDILVNNAGIFPRAEVLDVTEQIWDDVHNINLKGTFFCAQRAARLMIAQGTGGRIVNVASVSALQPDARGAHYCASKAGVVAVTKSLALALAPYGIAVNAIAPGLTDTAQPRAGMTEDEIRQWGERNPWGRVASPRDIARAALYLASDLSEYVTGQTVFVNGGQLMVP
jgi:NAD(P)-dependent dehydrogenase (short-subunit alcohol dehydrogenase family)